jgi:hypothetical protein
MAAAGPSKGKRRTSAFPKAESDDGGDDGRPNWHS